MCTNRKCSLVVVEKEEAFKLTRAQVKLIGMKGIVKYASSSSDRQSFDAVASIQNLLEVHCIRKAISAKQAIIKDFFGHLVTCTHYFAPPSLRITQIKHMFCT